MIERDSYADGDAASHDAMRRKLFEPVQLRHDGIALRAHMLDLSASGALLHCERRAPRPGSGIIIQTDGMRVAAHVVWVDGKKFDVHFDAPLDAATIRGLTDG
ncbi:PilZ domain-containing protein [Sphingobium rhizovicinum]|uniref:PilZ domain-containing protein n=1 Tax=Sphingobium rhizovicinum TaxID=432308 RepID=A0ABV7NE37_9SPHN